MNDLLSNPIFPCIETKGSVTTIDSGLPKGLIQEYWYAISFFLIMLVLLPLWASIKSGHLEPYAILTMMAAVVFGFYFFRHLALQYQYHVVFDVAGETIEIQYQSNFQQWYNKTFFSKDRVYPFKEIKHFFQQQECFTRSHCHPYCFQIRTIFSNNYPLLMLRDEEAFVQVKAFLATHFAIRTSTDY